MGMRIGDSQMEIKNVSTSFKKIFVPSTENTWENEELCWIAVQLRVYWECTEWEQQRQRRGNISVEQSEFVSQTDLSEEQDEIE